MANKTEQINVHVTPERKEEIEEAAKGDYSGASAYVRAMVRAAESDILALDPRTNDESTHTDINSVEEAANALDDTVLLNALTEDKQYVEDVTESITEEFEEVLVERLAEMADDKTSPVEDDGKGNYGLE